MTKEQIKIAIEKRINQLKADEDEITKDFENGEIPDDMWTSGVCECVNGICELEEILKLF